MASVGMSLLDYISRVPLLILVIAFALVLHLVYGAQFVMERIRGVIYLFRGISIIDQAYKKAQGQPFKVSTPTNNIMMVTTEDLYTEVKFATHRNLSLNAAAKELLQPQYTMPLFKWQDARKTSDGGAFTRAIRISLTAHLPHFQPHLERIIDDEMTHAIAVSDPIGTGSTHVKIFPMVKHMVSKLNCYVFFGPDLWQNEEFVKAALEYPQTTVFAAELVRNLPTFLRPLVARIATNWGRAEKTLVDYLAPVVEERLATRDKLDKVGEDSSLNKPADVVQWMVDVSPRKNWTTTLMTGQILAVWVPSVHQISMVTTFAIQDLCLHKDYVEPLREEIRQVLGGEAITSVRDVERLPLLDSFLRESIRMTNTDPVVMRRKAVEPHVFRDGTRVAKGDWVCIPQQAIMMDSSKYHNPHEFDGFRFARANNGLRQGQRSLDTSDKVETKLSDATHEWSAWGIDPAACPGRWYAALIIKLIVVHVLVNWDCELLDEKAPRSMTWRTNCFPREDTRVSFRRTIL